MPENHNSPDHDVYSIFYDGVYDHPEHIAKSRGLDQAEQDAYMDAFILRPYHTAGYPDRIVTWARYVRAPADKHEWDAEHHRRRFLPIEYMNKIFPCGESEQQAIDQYVHEAKAFMDKGLIHVNDGGRLQDDGTRSPSDGDRYWNGRTETFAWDTVDHEHVTMTAEEFMGLAAKICERSYAIREHARMHKNAGVEADFEHDRHWPGYVEPIVEEEEEDEPEEAV